MEAPSKKYFSDTLNVEQGPSWGALCLWQPSTLHGHWHNTLRSRPGFSRMLRMWGHFCSHNTRNTAVHKDSDKDAHTNAHLCFLAYTLLCTLSIFPQGLTLPTPPSSFTPLLKFYRMALCTQSTMRELLCVASMMPRVRHHRGLPSSPRPIRDSFAIAVSPSPPPHPLV
jgi:hypothetical protein